MNRKIDDMKKESKKPRNTMIVGYLLFALTFSYMYYNGKSFFDKDIITMFLFNFMVGTFSLYGWLYAITYRVEFDDNKVLLKTLFRKVEIDICDIEKYTCNRYRKSAFYQFDLFVKGKKILINTRYKEEFEQILINHNIEILSKGR